MSTLVKGLIEKQGYTKVVASTSAFGKDLAPRLGALLDVQPITDVISIEVHHQHFTLVGWRRQVPTANLRRQCSVQSAVGG